MEHVFIVGIARTGSKIYMSMLNNHTDVDVITEVHYLAPRFIRRDAVTALELDSRPLVSDARIREAMDKMYSGELLGDFWKRTSKTPELQYRLADLDKDQLRARIADSSGDAESLFRILIEDHARISGKVRGGAKSPVDISRVSTLMKWFPDAKIIHLIRDPRAIYTSMAVRDVPGADKPGLPRLYAMARRLPYLILEFRQAAALHRACCHLDNYYLSRFEDMLSDPATYMRKLCVFLGVDYNENMLTMKRVDSSYPGKETKGVDASAASEWKSHILASERAVVDFALRREMALFGYEK